MRGTGILQLSCSRVRNSSFVAWMLLLVLDTTRIELDVHPNGAETAGVSVFGRGACMSSLKVAMLQ